MAEQQLITAKHILVETLKQANALKQQLDEGAEFETLAKAHSLCPSRANGGDLGVIPPGRTVQPFESALVDLPVGGISDPVSTHFGYHIIQRTS